MGPSKNATKNPARYNSAETQITILLNREAVEHASGVSGGQAWDRSRGATKYIFRKLAAMSAPEIPKTQGLCRDNATSQGQAVSVEATDAPRPASTSRDGRAQQSNVPTELKSEK